MKRIIIIAITTIALFSCKNIAEIEETVNPETLWVFQTEGEIWSSPTLKNEILYFGNDAGTFYAVQSKDGSLLWKSEIGGLIRSQPVVDKGVVYFVSDSGYLYALDSLSGDVKWSTNIGSDIRQGLPGNGGYDFRQSSPVIIEETLYVGSSDSNLYSINTLNNGSVNWKFTGDGMIRSTPYYYNGMVFIGTWAGTVYSVNAETGIENWQFHTNGMINSDFNIIDNLLLIGSRDAHLYALNTDNGIEVWNHRFKNGSWIESSCVVENDTIYLGSSDSMVLISMDNRGNVNWRFNTGAWSWGTAAISGDRVYIGSINSPYYTSYPHSSMALYGVNKISGKLEWSFKPREKEGFIKGGVFTTPVISNGVVYFGGIDGRFYAVIE